MKQYFKAILIPMIIWGVLSYIFSMVDGNQTSILLGDFWQQIYPYSIDFWSHLIDGTLQDYSIQYGLGTAMGPTYAYYAINPTSLLIYILNLFCPKIVVGAGVLMFNGAITAAGMLTYCRYKFGKDCKWNVLAAIAYSFIGTGVNHAFITPWVPSIALFPIIIMLFEKMMAEDKKFNACKAGCIYALILGFAIISNFLMGFIVCLGLVIFFFTQKFENKENFVLKIKRMIIFSIPAVLMGTPIYATIINHIQNSDNTNNLSSDINWSSAIANMLPFATEYNLKTDMATYIVFAFIVCSILYFISKEITAAEKKTSAIRIGVLLISLIVPPIQYIWYGFDKPDGLPGRFFFILAFIIITNAVRYMNVENKTVDKKTTAIVSFVIGTCAIISLFNKNMIAVITAAALTLFVLFLIKNNKKKTIALICYAEIILNTFLCICVSGVKPIGDERVKYIPNTVDRMNYNEEQYMTYMEGLNNTYTFNTFINSNLRDIMYDFNAPVGNTTYQVDADVNQVLLSTTGFKYQLTTDVLETDYFTPLHRTSNATLYEYNNTLSLGFIIPNEVATIDTNKTGSELFNEYVRIISGEEKQYQNKFENFTFSSSPATDGYITTITAQEDVDNVIFSLTDINNRGRDRIAFTNVKKGQKIEVKTDKEICNIRAFSYDVNIFEKWYSNASQEQLTGTRWANNTLTGRVSVKNDNSLMLVSLAYNDNFKAYVDNKETKIIPLLNKAFIGVYVPEGVHSIKIVYENDIENMLIIVPITTLIGLMITLFISNKMRKKYINKY